MCGPTLTANRYTLDPNQLTRNEREKDGSNRRCPAANPIEEGEPTNREKDMATNPTSRMIQHLRRVLLQGDAGLTDEQLLGSFIEGREEAAFAALVKRHGRLVWNVCRRLLGEHDAEDAFQATFLVLCRKAASIRRREMLASWLYGVAHQTALQARRTAARRRAREKQVVDMPEPVAGDRELWNDLQPLLDRELSRLPDNYRVVVLLCDLEGKTRKQAARQLGVPEGTVASRLTRARTMLAKRLARYGLAVTGGTIAAVLPQQALSASAPPSVVSSTIKAAILVSAGQAAGTISAGVAALAEGVLKTMLLAKLKHVTATLLVVVGLTGVAGLIYRTQAAEPTKTPKAAENSDKQKKASVEKREERDARTPITPATRKAIEAGLTFLAKEQHEDGSFGKRGYQGNVGITSLAGLAFLAAGHEPDDSPRGKIIGKALDFVLSQENPDGGHPGYLHNPAASPHGPMYNHGFATLFLAFVHGKEKEKDQAAKRDEVLERAVKLIVSSQNAEGGWRYTPGSRDADISVTACQMMALAAARQAGLTVPKKTTDAGVSYVKQCFKPATGGFAYMRKGTDQPGFARTAAAVATLQAMGVHKGEEVEQGLVYLVKNRPAPAPRPDLKYFYGHYYYARLMHGRGGAAWRGSYAAIERKLLGQQRADGSWEDQIDPHYATAMACLVLLTPEGRLAVRAAEVPKKRRADESPPAAKGKGKQTEPVKSDKERIQGAWRLVKPEVNGVEVPLFGRPKEGWRVTFTNDKWSSNFAFDEKDLTFKLDPASKPKAIDLHFLENPDKTLPGIYQFKGDELMICVCIKGEAKRPSAFENYWRAASYTALFVLKREKSGE